MKALAAVWVLVALALGLSAWMGTARAGVAHASGLRGWPPTESSSSLLQRGHVLCTATVKSQVAVGHAVSVKYTVHNVSKRSVTIMLWLFSSGFTLNSPDGTTYDTGARYEALPGIPPPERVKLRPGATRHLGTQSAFVRWTGPLQITPECLGKQLPVLRVDVAAPWPGPAESAAIGEVAAAAGHLLDNCLPQTPGVPVDGQVEPSSGIAPPLDARCSVSLSWDGDFLQAQVLVLVPPDLPGVEIYQPYETLWPITEFLPLAAGPPYEAIAWEFVVTRDRAIPVASATTWAKCDGSESFGWGEGGASPGVESIPATC